MEPNLSTIRARRAELARYRQQIDAEDKELESAERALTGFPLPRRAQSRPRSSCRDQANSTRPPPMLSELELATNQLR